MVTRGDRRKQEMTYDNQNCNDEGHTFDPGNGQLAFRKLCPKVLE
jgi:hypothetical protein